MRQRVLAGLGAAVALAGVASAQSIDDYTLTRTFTLPLSFNGTGDFDDNVLFDALPDGRLLVLNGGQISVETGVGSGSFSGLGSIPGFQPFFGSSFLSISPDGTRAVAGSNGEGFVTVFDTANPSSFTNFSVADFDGAWIDNTSLAISNFNGVDVLNTSTGAVTNIVSNLGGASAGIAFDAAGNLYTGNGFDFAPGGSDTGSIKAFSATVWQSALAGGSAIDFENSGVEVANILSAASLGFDSLGNLFVAGADFFGGSGDLGYAALVDGDSVLARLADPSGTSVIDAMSSSDIIRLFNSPQFTIDGQLPPSWVFNDATGELYLRYFEQGEVFVYQIPTPGSLAILGLGGLAASRRRRAAVALSAVAVMSGTAAAQTSNPWADSVVSYDKGSNPVAGFTDPTTALGSPTRFTNPTSPFGGAVTPFQPAFGTSEIVSIGEGGHLTVAFNEPVRNDAGNPFGLDLLIFGNAFYVDTAYPNGVAGGLFAEGGSISVSADGINFFDVLNVDADGAFPTLGFLDPTGAVTVPGQGQVTGTIESDFTKPVDPNFDPTGLTLAEILAGYNGSGGGVGIDIGLLGLSEISFVRIDNPLGSGFTPEIDGFSDVAVPAPGASLLLAGAAGFFARRRRSAGA